MIVLDTNVLSELMRPAPSERVVRWVAAQPATSLYTTSVTQAEILHGIMLLPSGRRRRAGRPISHFDAQIAAVARSAGAGIATRNVADYDSCGVQVINPWEA